MIQTRMAMMIWIRIDHEQIMFMILKEETTCTNQFSLRLSLIIKVDSFMNDSLSMGGLILNEIVSFVMEDLI